MVPPQDLFGVIPTWVGVYTLTFFAFAVAGLVLYRRAIQLILLGKPSKRFDRPITRFLGVVAPVFGQIKVLQSVSLQDRAGLAHFFIFWGFLSFFVSYVLFIYADSAWPGFSSTVLSPTGTKVFVWYLEILALGFLVVLIWASLRRWIATPRRLSFDLTQRSDAAIILTLIGTLMVCSLLASTFYVAAGGKGPEAAAPIGKMLGTIAYAAGLPIDAANVCTGFSGGFISEPF